MIRLWLLPIALLAALGGCETGGCGNRLLMRAAAPGGRHEVVLFGRDCGATTGFSTQVSLVRPGGAPAGGGNLFVADGEGRVAAVIWLAPDRLLISYRRGSPPFRQVSELDGVRIQYRAL